MINRKKCIDKMADRIPLIVNSNAKQIQELPTTDALLIHSGAGKGLEFTNNPGGGTGDVASITYEAVSGEQTNLKIAVANDGAPSAGPDNIELSTPNGASINITANTASTNSTSGALVVTGGVGIGKSVYIEKNLSVGQQLNLTGTSAAGDSDINLSGGSDGLAVVTNTSNSGKISFVTKNSGGTNSTIQLEHQKINFSGPNITGTAVTFSPTGAAPIYGVRAYGLITAKQSGSADTVYTADINGGNISGYRRLAKGAYRINFTHAMPHNNYVVLITPQFIDPGSSLSTQPEGVDVHVRSNSHQSVNFCRVTITESQSDSDAKDQSFHIAVIC